MSATVCRTARRLLAPLLAAGLLAGGLPAASAVSNAPQPAWVPANGGHYEAVVETLARDPDLPAIRYAGGTQGFFRTTNGGATWQQGNAGLPEGCEMSAILPLRGHPATLLAGCNRSDFGSGLFQSDDRGLHWHASGTGILPNVPVRSIIQIGNSGMQLLAATETGIYRTADGTRWSLVLHGTAGVLRAYCLAHDPFSALTYFAGTSSGAFKSVDAGATWFPINNSLGGATSFYQIAADPARRDRLFMAGGDSGIYSSSDGGNSWTSLDNGPSTVYALAVQSLAAVPSSELTPDLKKYLAAQNALAHKKLKKGEKRQVPETTIVFAGTDSGVQASTDGGNTWSDRTSDANQSLPSKAKPYTGLPDSTPIYALMGFGRSAELVVGGTRAGIYRTRDLGRSWAGDGSGLPQDLTVTALALDPANPGSVFMGTSDSGVWHIQGSGATVATVNDGLPDGATVNDLLLQPSRQDRLVAALGAPSGGVAISSGGENWSSENRGLAGRYVNAIVSDPHDADTLYAGLSRDGVGWSADGGDTWKLLHVGLPAGAAVWSLAVDAHDSLTILAGTDQGLFVTADQGDHWTVGGQGLPGVAAALIDDPAHRGWFLAGTGSGLYRSVDGGMHWQAVPGALAGLALTRVIRDPVVASTLLAATPGGVYQSKDGGLTWTGFGLGMPMPGGATAVAAAGPVDYAGGPHGIYSLSPTSPVSSAARGVTYYAVVGHSIPEPFLSFWKAHGGLPVFGYPRTEPIHEGGVLVQYFQRARFEYHPGIHGVVLTPLGSAFTKGRSFGTVARFKNGPLRIYVPQTRHSLGKPFLDFWQKHGGAAVFGYPISEVVQEENGDGTGTAYVTQYFQNARLEYHPEAKDARFSVQLGLLGDQLLRQKGWLQ
jgi:photosystem II stability/assembly factor-like uncharacterized protein